MIWRLSHKADPAALALADRHYSRQQPGTPQFMPPGRTLVFVSTCGRAVWGSLLQTCPDHAWPGAWVCCIFRNEGAGLSSDLIREAVACTRFAWGEPPAEGMVTFVKEDAVRRKRDPGRCFRKAGFVEAGRTKARDLLALRLPAEAMPEAEAPLGWQLGLWLAA
jgi:hypothetical protein